MACAYKAPNGNLSKVFDTLRDSNGLATAVVNFEMFQSEDFNSWYGATKRSEDGEPILGTGIVTNDEGDVRELLNKLPSLSEEDTNKQVSYLSNIFKSHGIDIDIQEDLNAIDKGFVIGTGKDIKLRYNPSKVTTDTIFHEFGHIYVDLIGYDSAFIQLGIKQFRDTPLWHKISRLNPKLNEEQLGKEVLTTAIGMEAARRYDGKTKYLFKGKNKFLDTINSWLAWVGEMFRKVAERLGVKYNVAERLAYDLTSGKLRSTLSGKVSPYKQRSLNLSYDSVIKTLEGIEGSFKLDNSEEFYTHKNIKDTKFERTSNAMNRVLYKFEREAAIRHAAASKTPLFKRYQSVREIEQVWADKREEGTGIHGIAEQYIKQIKAGLTKIEAKKYVLANLYKPENAGQKDADGVRIYEGMNKDQVENYIGIITDFIDDLYKKGYTLFTEFTIGSIQHEVAGTNDIIAVRPDGKLVIFDFKTKEFVISGDREISQFDKINMIDRKNLFLKGPLSHIKNTQGNKYAIQLSIYRMIFESYGLEVADAYIVPLVGQIEERDNQYNYKNLKRFTNSNATNFVDGMFKMPNLTNDVKSIFNSKENIEETLEHIENTEETFEELRARLSKIADLQDWVTNVIADLHRSIILVRKRSTDKYLAAEYQVKIKDLIDRMQVEDEFEAIAAYSAYITGEVERMAKKLFTHTTGTEGNVKVNKGYATLTWEDIKEMEKNNPENYRKFISFLVNAKSFLGQIIFIQDLPKTVTTEEESGVIELLKVVKENESDLTDLKWHINRLSRELDARYFEISNSPLFTEGDTVKAFEKFFEAQKDETWFQANMASMADTHHPYIANVIKMYDREVTNGDMQGRRLIEEFTEKTKNIDINKFVEKATGKFITALNYDDYYSDVDNMFKEADIKYSDNRKARNKFIANFFNTHTEKKTADEISRMEQNKKKELGPTFNTWKTEQMYQNRYFSRSKAYYKPKQSIYQNEQYSKLTKEEIETLNYIQNLLYFLVDHVGGTIIENGYIPAVSKSNRTDKEKLISHIGFHEAHTRNIEELNDRNGELIHILPFKFAHKLGQEKYEAESEASSPETLKQIRERNRKLAEYNKAIHAATIQHDLTKVIPLFIRSAITHKSKNKIEFEILRVYDSLLDNFKLVESKNGALFVDKAKRLAGKKVTTKQTRMENSKLFGHFKNWLEAQFYEQFEKDEGQFTKIARLLQNFTSFKTMALNPYSAANNTTYGIAMSRMEAAGGAFYSAKDFNWSGKEYYANMLSYFSDDYESTDFGSKASAFMQEYPIMMDYREIAINDDDAKFNNAILRGTAWVYSKAYFMQHASEHMLQNRILLTMARSHKVVNGKIISYEEFERGKLHKIDASAKDITEQREFLKANKETKKKLQKEWKGFTSFYDAYEFKETSLGRGRLSLKEEFKGLNQNELGDFKRRVLGINHGLHGIYNREDAGAIQRYALGRLALQFRKWMYPGWTRRYGIRFFEEFWNERRRFTEAGIYATSAKLLAKPFIDWRNNSAERKAQGEQLNAIKAFGNLIKSYSRYVGNAKLHWHSLEPYEKVAVKQTMFEWATFSFLVFAASLFMGMKDDDDEEKGLGYYFVANQLNRSVLELSTYVPLAVGLGVDKPFVGGGIFNEYNKLMKSPFATINSIEKIFILGTQLIGYPFMTDEQRVYQSGVYHGQTKLLVSVKKLIPLYNQVFRTMYLDKMYRYYRLF